MDTNTLSKSDLVWMFQSPLRDFISEKYAALVGDPAHGRSLTSAHFYLWRSALSDEQNLHCEFRTALYALAEMYGLHPQTVRALDDSMAEELISMIVYHHRNSPKAVVFYAFIVTQCLKNMAAAHMAVAA